MPNYLGDPAFLKKFLDAIQKPNVPVTDDFRLQTWLSSLGPNLSPNQKTVLTAAIHSSLSNMIAELDCEYCNQLFGSSLITVIKEGKFGFENQGGPINPLFPDLLSAEIAKSEMAGVCSTSEMHGIVLSSGYGICFAACFLGIVAMAGFGTLGGSFGCILLLAGLAFAAYTADSDERVTPYKDAFFAGVNDYLFYNKLSSASTV